MLATQTIKTKSFKSSPQKTTEFFGAELEIEPEASQLAFVRDFISQAAKSCFFSHQAVFDIVLAANEAVANAIEHGSPSKNGTIKISYQCTAGNFVVKVKDTGRFQKVINIDNDCRGRGIMLMLALMDKVTFDETPEGTVVCLMKKCA